MFQIRTRTVFTSISLLALAFTASSCGETEASAPPVPMNVLRQSVQDYGRGHQIPPIPAPAPIPEETEKQYKAHVATLLAQEDFSQLERIAQELRTNKSRVKGGVWKLDSFYDGVAEPVVGDYPTDAEWRGHLALVKKWAAASPQSATARIALANAYLSFAYFARGTGYAKTVSAADWERFGKRVGQAKSILIEAAQLQEKCPYWYQAMLMVATDEGWDKKDVRALFDQAAAFEPAYYHYYRQYANFMLPKWYGKEGETQALAEEITAKLPEPDASIAYFEIASLLACQCDSERDTLTGISWPRVKQGYENLVRLYGTSEVKANRFAYMSYVAGDKSSARQAFATIENGRSHLVWRSEATFSAARDWANSSSP